MKISLVPNVMQSVIHSDENKDNQWSNNHIYKYKCVPILGHMNACKMIVLVRKLTISFPKEFEVKTGAEIKQMRHLLERT